MTRDVKKIQRYKKNDHQALPDDAIPFGKKSDLIDADVPQLL